MDKLIGKSKNCNGVTEFYKVVKPTQGPWVTGGPNNGWQVSAYEGGSVSKVIADVRFRKEVDGKKVLFHEDDPEAWANTNLIASAKDLLKACEMFLLKDTKAIEKAKEDLFKLAPEMKLRFEEAIAKAEGGK